MKNTNMIIRLTAILLLLSMPIFLLGQADAGEDKAICKGESTMIGTTGNSTNCYKWDPKEGLDDHTSPTPMANPSKTTTYTLTFTEEGFKSKSTDKVEIKVVESVEFKEDVGQKYGYDSYTNAMEHWKSVENGKNDPVTAEIKPIDAADGVYFKSTVPTKVTVNPKQATATPQTVTCNGIAKGESEIQANCGSEDGKTIKKIKVASYPLKTKSVAIRLVNETAYKSTDVPTAAIINYLNNTVYNQAVFKWNVTRLPAVTLDFDLNNDGMVDVGTVAVPVPFMSTDEMKFIRDNADAAGYDHIIFLVDNPTDGSLGFMGYGQKYGFVHADVSNFETNTIAHELGHGSFSFVHPDENGDSDNDNLMHSDNPNPFRLRKNQWDKIQN